MESDMTTELMRIMCEHNSIWEESGMWKLMVWNWELIRGHWLGRLRTRHGYHLNFAKWGYDQIFEAQLVNE